MATSIPTLITLPPELIRRIASFTPAMSVLALLRTNRRLYEICDDAVVFRDIIVKFAGGWDYKKLFQSSNGAKSTGEDLDKEMLKRYAVANSKAHNCVWPEDFLCEDDRPLPCKFELWAPHMVGLGHESAHPTTILPLSSRLEAMYKDVQGSASKTTMADIDIISFLLLNSELRKNYSSVVRDSHGAYIDPAQDLTILRDALVRISDPTSIFGNPSSPLFPLSYLINLRPVLFNQRDGLINMPSPKKIPFESMLDLPLPFSRGVAEDFQVSHLQYMTSLKFLEDGEWVGYYCFGQTMQRGVLFDPPMVGMKFACKDLDDESIELRAAGTDSVGTFNIEGSIVKATGSLRA